MINEQIGVIGTLRLVLTDANGNVKEDKTVKNLITSLGKTYIASRIASSSSTLMGYMAVGSSSTAPASVNTALGTELGRVIATPSSSSNIVTYSSTFGPGVGTGAIVEAGIFNAATAGIMLNRAIFSVINKDVADTLSINWNITIA